MGRKVVGWVYAGTLSRISSLAFGVVVLDAEP